MKILYKLLDYLGNDRWNKSPKKKSYLTLQQGKGLHTKATVDEGILYLHSVPYHQGLPEKQTVSLEQHGMAELISLLQAMGYEATPLWENQFHRSIVLMEVTNLSIEQKVTLEAFTSSLWSYFYPIYRMLRNLESDTEQARKQLHRIMADGIWLDFWANFFGVMREPGESDNNFIRRFTTWIFNPKTNNIALKELLSYRLKTHEIQITDEKPGEFEIQIGLAYLDASLDLHQILSETKGAGIRYYLNYLSTRKERIAFQCKHNTYSYNIPLTGTQVCGTYPETSTYGAWYPATIAVEYEARAQAQQAFKRTGETLSGSDERFTNGQVQYEEQVSATAQSNHDRTLYPLAGDNTCGTIPTVATVGVESSMQVKVEHQEHTHEVSYPLCGTIHTGEEVER